MELTPEAAEAVRQLQGLSDDERRIAEMVIGGRTVQEIGEELKVDPSVVSKQVTRIAKRLEKVKKKQVVQRLVGPGKIHKKKRGAEPALFTYLQQIPAAEEFQFSAQQQVIIRTSHTCSSLKEISRVTGIPYNNVHTQAKRIYDARAERKAAFRRNIGPGQRRLPDGTAEEMMRQFQEDPGRTHMMYVRYASGEKPDPEFQVALLTAGAEQDRLWRQRGKLQKLMSMQGKEGYVVLKLTREQVNEIQELLDYLGKHPVYVDPVEKTATYIFTKAEAARIGLGTASEWSKKVRQEARRLAG